MNAIDVTEQSFDSEVVQSSTPVLVDFWGPGCGPCKRMAPVVDSIADEFAGRVKVVKVDTSEAPALGARFRIMSIPTFLVVKQGQVVAQFVGSRSREDLVDALNEYV